MELVHVSIAEDGSVLFTCNVCKEECPAPPGVPVDVATREFLAMHPVCAAAEEHVEGCPGDAA